MRPAPTATAGSPTHRGPLTWRALLGILLFAMFWMAALFGRWLHRRATPDKAGVLVLYQRLRNAFTDFHPEIHWQTVDGDIVTTYKVYHGTHNGEFLGIAPTGKRIQFETVDAMRVRDGKITDHWGVANLYSVLQQLEALPT